MPAAAASTAARYSVGLASTLPASLIASLLDHRQLVTLGDDLAPLVDLLVDVDLDRADAGAAAVQRRGERAARCICAG